MNHFSIRVWNFRSLDYLDWSPKGVCLLSGPNGAGKSTTLAALSFMRNALLRGVPQAIRFAGGATAFRSMRATADADVIFEIESANVIWRLEIPVEGEGIHSYFGERLTHDGAVILVVPRLQANYQLGAQQRGRGDRPEINTLLTIDPSPWLKAFCDLIRSIRVYDDFNLDRAPRPAPEDDGDLYLHPSGANVVPVLRNWKSAPRQFKGQFEWVIQHLRLAFPDIVEDIEFLTDGTAAFYPVNAPDPEAKLPLSIAAAGLITGLLQLTAVAGAKEGSLIAFDEMENQLHPHAIRLIISAMRKQANLRDLTIILTTHSPVVMNEFKDREDRFYLLERVFGKALPVALDEARSVAWLSHFALGDLYERLEFGAPPCNTTAPVPEAKA